MCGIVGYVGHRTAVDILIAGLQRLEYRGYDSAGVGLFHDGQIRVVKSQGRLENVMALLREDKDGDYKESVCGIGHTRWATHGKPTTQNAHPHKTGHVALVHNGIIENHMILRKKYEALGYRPQSETDSELIGFMILEEMKQGCNLSEGVRRSFSHLQGQCSIVAMSELEPDVVVGVRNGSPLVVGFDPQGGMMVASDAQSLVQLTQKVIFLEHGDMVVGTKFDASFYHFATGESILKKETRLDWPVDVLDKGPYPHFMLKEIYEQPVTFKNTLEQLVSRSHLNPFQLKDDRVARILDSASELHLVACGTSWHAALLGKYWIESLAGIPVHVDLASEFRYRTSVLSPNAVVVGVTQSGETADTLAVMREMKAKGIRTLGVCNVRGSSISREADGVIYTAAGPEIGVAATKTFTAQMLTLLIVSGYLAGHRKVISQGKLEKLFEELVYQSTSLTMLLDSQSEMVQAVITAIHSLSSAKGFFFIGRGLSYPIAIEGALKIKEIAYDYAEGYAAGELKHGPIAMIDQGMVAVVLAPKDIWREKTISNLEEVRARGALIVAVGHAGDEDLRALSDYWIPLPHFAQSAHEALNPFLLAPVLQLFAYYRAVDKGTNIDKPRNLAKSVTVE